MFGRTFSRQLVILFRSKVASTAGHSAGSWLFDLSPKSNVRPYIHQAGYSISVQSQSVQYGSTFSRMLVHLRLSS